jgi:hypothetical protein
MEGSGCPAPLRIRLSFTHGEAVTIYESIHNHKIVSVAGPSGRR